MLTAMAASRAMMTGSSEKWMLKNSRMMTETRVRVEKMAMRMEFRNTNFLLQFLIFNGDQVCFSNPLCR